MFTIPVGLFYYSSPLPEAYRPNTGTIGGGSLTCQNQANAYDTSSTTVDNTTYSRLVRSAPTSVGTLIGTMTYSGGTLGIATGSLYARLTTFTESVVDGENSAFSSASLKYSTTGTFTTVQTWRRGSDANQLSVTILDNVTISLSNLQVQVSLRGEMAAASVTASSAANIYDVVFVGTLENFARPSLATGDIGLMGTHPSTYAYDTVSSTIDYSTYAQSTSLADVSKCITYKNFDSRSGMSGTLYCRVSADLTSGSGAMADISYSTNGGSSFTSIQTIYDGESISADTPLSVALTNIDLSQLQVSSFVTNAAILVYDIVFIMS